MSNGLKLSLLGAYQCELNNEPVQLVSAKGKALLAYLAVNGRSYSRTALATLLWSNLPDTDARRNLRVEVMKLRQRVGAYLLTEGQTLAFNSSLPHEIDVVLFEEGGKNGETAVSLYRGDFLEDLFVRQAPLFETWVEQERSRLHAKMLTLRLQLAKNYAKQQQYTTAREHAQHVLNADPTREAAHRLLIQIFAQQGNRSAALAQFETCRTRLATQLGLEPAAETLQLIEQVREGKFEIRDGGLTNPQSPIPNPQYTNTPTDPSPFIAGPPITEPHRFYGRERIIRRLFALWRQRPLQNAAIIGPRRSGKTSLLHYLRQITTANSSRPDQRTNWLPNPLDYRWVFVDFQDPRLGSQAGLLTYLLDQMEIPQPASCTLETFLDLVSDQLINPTIILLDEIGVALSRYPELDDAFWESLRSLATNHVDGNLAFVLTAQERPETLAQGQGMGSPFFNIFGYTATLGPLTEEAAIALIKSSPQPVPADNATWILQKSGRWPILLQILCREHLLAHEEGIAEWQEEAWEQAQPFKNLLSNLVP
ncbi:MAG: BTAD domain-containing putative transcriptional regulator [Chloroflexota bacterium]